MSIVHHLAVDGVSWRILLEDLNIARNAAPQRPAGGAAGDAWDVVCPVGGAPRWYEHARRPEVVEQAQVWRQGRADHRRCCRHGTHLEVDTYVSAGQIGGDAGRRDDAEVLLGEVPTAFHAGIQDILLIAFALAWGEACGRYRRRPADRHRCGRSRAPR